MDTLLQAGFSNTAWAAALAAVAWSAGRIWRRRPALAHVLWLAVMLKLVTPSLVSVSVPAWPAATRATPSPVLPTQVSVAGKPRTGTMGLRSARHTPSPLRSSTLSPAPYARPPARSPGDPS